jgi:drug/metabolite transporter (DMT)-like permease
VNAIWFSLAVNTSYFLADLFIKLGSGNHSAGRLIYIRSVLTVALASLWLVSSGELNNLPNFNSIGLLLFCSVLCALGLFYYVKAIQTLHFVNVAVIGICGAFIHYGLGIVLNHEQVNNWFFISAFLSILGILIQWRKTVNHKGLFDALISAVCWGFGYALLSIPLANTSAIWGTWIMEFTILILSAFYLILNDHTFSLLRPPVKDLKIIAIAIFTILGSVLVNISYQKFSLNVLGFMQLAFFPYSLLAGYFLFKEKLNKWEWIGNTMVILGLAVYFYTCV